MSFTSIWSEDSLKGQMETLKSDSGEEAPHATGPNLLKVDFSPLSYGFIFFFFFQSCLKIGLKVETWGRWKSESSNAWSDTGACTLLLYGAMSASWAWLPQLAWDRDVLQQLSNIWKAFSASMAGGGNYFWSVIEELRREGAWNPEGYGAIQNALQG